MANGLLAARVGASLGLGIILAAAAILIGGACAAVLLVTVDETPAAVQADAEQSDVELVRCSQNLRRMTAALRVTNRSSASSSYFVDVEFVRGTGTVLEVVTVVIEDVGSGDSRRESVSSVRSPPARFDCRVGDVDRLAA